MMKVRAIMSGAVMIGSLTCSQSHKQSASANAAAQDAKQSTAHSSVPALPENRDAEVQVGPTTMLVQGAGQRDPASKYYSETAVVVQCDKEWKQGQCLWIEAAIDNAKPHIGIMDFSVIRWTDEEVLAEPAGIGHMCYNDVLLIKLAEPFRGEFPSKGTTTLTRTPRVASEEARKACETLSETTPVVYRVLWSSFQN